MTSVVERLLELDAAAPVFRREGAWITAGDLRDRASRVLLPPGDDPIFVHASSAANLCAALLACAAEQRALALPAHAQPKYLAEIGAAGVLQDEDFLNGGGARRTLSAQPPTIAFYTSGSTGAPKKVEKPLSLLETEASVLDAMWGREASHTVATVSHQHFYGLLFRIVWPIASGRTSNDASAVYWEDLKGQMAGATLVSSPAHLTRLPPRGELFEPGPSIVFSSGQLLAPAAARNCAAVMGQPVTEVLGSTETGGIAWRRQTEGEFWTPLQGVEVSQGENGDLLVRSPFLLDDAPHATGDGIDFPAGTGAGFRLRPRGDRVAKIDGKRVSLTRVEAALERCDEVSAAAALTVAGSRETLAAVVALSESGRVELAKHGAFRLSRRFRSMLAHELEPAERPKQWRFVEAIPTDSQGKRILSSLRDLFEAPSPCDDLDLDIRENTGAEATVAFTLPPDLIFFDGHFPGRPILPGVGQVHLAALIAQRLWDVWPSDSDLARLKFRRVLCPGDAVELKLKWDARIGRLWFSYRCGDVDASQGEMGGFKN